MYSKTAVSTQSRKALALCYGRRHEGLLSLPPSRSRTVSTQYFDVQAVDGADLLANTYQLRYQVFCIERRLLNWADYPECLESDEFDAHAIHILARHKRGGDAGTVRLVLHSELGFPMQSHCAFDAELAHLNEPSSPVLRRYAEISRLAVSKDFRRRSCDTMYGSKPRGTQRGTLADGTGLPPPHGPEIVTGIFKYMYHESKRIGITHWIVAMERGLSLLLRRMGFPFKAAGPEADYSGCVRPYIASIADIERYCSHHRPTMFAYMSHGLHGGPEVAHIN